MPPRSSNDLSSRQCERIIATLDGQAAYLRRLLERMGRLGWLHQDQLYVDAVTLLRAIGVMRLTLQRIALFQSAFNEDAQASLELPETEYVIDLSKRPWEAGYRTPKPRE
jgi:hypothetical protein